MCTSRIMCIFCSFQIQQYDAASANYAGHQFNEYWPQQPQPQHLRTSISGNSPSPHSSPSLASEEYDYANSQQNHHSNTYFNMYYHPHHQHQNGFQYTQQQSGSTLSPLAASRMSGHSPSGVVVPPGAAVPGGSDPMSSWPSEM